MKIRGIVLSELQTALARTNALYDGNLRITDDKLVGRCLQFRLAAIDSRKYGARKSASGRHMPAASWEAFRDLFREVYKINPEAVIYTALATYRGSAHFEEIFPETGRRNVGGVMNPVTMPALSIPRESTVEFGVLAPGLYTKVRTIKHSDLRRCPFTIFVADHYRADGSCKCDDPEHRAMMIRDWEYSEKDFRGIPLRSGS